jgi:hypothetical protein
VLFRYTDDYSTRHDVSCRQADRFTAKASRPGTRASLLRQNLSQRDINQRLSEEPGDTQAVDAFLRTLDGHSQARPGSEGDSALMPQR